MTAADGGIRRGQVTVESVVQEMMTAVALGDSSRVRLILRQYRSDFAEGDLWIAFRLASKGGDIAVCEAFLDSGVNVNVSDADGLTPLMTAAQFGQTEVVRLLLHRGAFVDATTRSGATALHSAAAANQYDAAQLLLGAGAAVDRRTTDGYTAMDLARTRSISWRVPVLGLHFHGRTFRIRSTPLTKLLRARLVRT